MKMQCRFWEEYGSAFLVCIGGVRSHTFLSREHAPAGTVCVLWKVPMNGKSVELGGCLKMEERKLCKVNENRIFCGVCAGLARYFRVDVTVVRLIFAARISIAIGILTGRFAGVVGKRTTAVVVFVTVTKIGIRNLIVSCFHLIFSSIQ